MKKLLIRFLFILLCYTCVSATPIELKINDIQKSNTITLPSGVVVSATDYIFCEQGCEDIVMQSSKKWWLLGLAVVGLVFLKDDCCCDIPPGIPNTPPTGVLPPVVQPPTAVPESGTIILLLIGLIGAISLYEYKRIFN